MANTFLSRLIPKTIRCLTTTVPSVLLRLRPLSAASLTSRRVLIPTSHRALSTHSTTSSNEPDPKHKPNWSNIPPKETILIDGCDFEHWLVVMEEPEGDPTRDEIIDGYIKTMAHVTGSEEEARMKIYSVSTRHYFAFGALCSEQLSNKLKELPKVRCVMPDSYWNPKEKDYGGEPFINGQAVPYDPKYHQEWLMRIRNSTPVGPRNYFDWRRRRRTSGERDMQTRPPRRAHISEQCRQICSCLS